MSFGPEIAADLNAALRREWLVTNGLGGYASSTVAGVNTRRYHGLLVAALNPPVERTVLVAGSVDRATYDGHKYPLSTYEYGDGTIDPKGYRYVQTFELDGSIPVWTFAFGDALLEKRIWMAYEAQLRRNQILAASLPYPLVDGAMAASVVDHVGRALLTGLGPRSLSPDDPSYRGGYAGDPAKGSAQTSEPREASPPRSPQPTGPLSDRETQVLRLLALGQSSAEIASELVLSVRTVEKHVANLYAKIDARGRADAATYALRHGLLSATT